jgi:hypothetical protein
MQSVNPHSNHGIGNARLDQLNNSNEPEPNTTKKVNSLALSVFAAIAAGVIAFGLISAPFSAGLSIPISAAIVTLAVFSAGIITGVMSRRYNQRQKLEQKISDQIQQERKNQIQQERKNQIKQERQNLEMDNGFYNAKELDETVLELEKARDEGGPVRKEEKQSVEERVALLYAGAVYGPMNEAMRNKEMGKFFYPTLRKDDYKKDLEPILEHQSMRITCLVRSLQTFILKQEKTEKKENSPLHRIGYLKIKDLEEGEYLVNKSFLSTSKISPDFKPVQAIANVSNKKEHDVQQKLSKDNKRPTRLEITLLEDTRRLDVENNVKGSIKHEKEVLLPAFRCFKINKIEKSEKGYSNITLEEVELDSIPPGAKVHDNIL